eukprot:4068869-Pleurochrysis_carterae.AAC.2
MVRLASSSWFPSCYPSFPSGFSPAQASASFHLSCFWFISAVALAIACALGRALQLSLAFMTAPLRLLSRPAARSRLHWKLFAFYYSPPPFLVSPSRPLSSLLHSLFPARMRLLSLLLRSSSPPLSSRRSSPCSPVIWR